MDSERRETDVLLFSGGIVLFEGFTKHALATIRGNSAEISSEDDPAGAPAHFAERA
jgi:hypothetical protein